MNINSYFGHLKDRREIDTIFVYIRLFFAKTKIVLNNMIVTNKVISMMTYTITIKSKTIHTHNAVP